MEFEIISFDDLLPKQHFDSDLANSKKPLNQAFQRSQSLIKEAIAHQKSPLKMKQLLLEAMESLLNVLETDPEYPPLYLSLAYICYMIEDYPKTRKYLEQAKQLNPFDLTIDKLIKKVLQREQRKQIQTQQKGHFNPEKRLYTPTVERKQPSTSDAEGIQDILSILNQLAPKLKDIPSLQLKIKDVFNKVLSLETCADLFWLFKEGTLQHQQPISDKKTLILLLNQIQPGIYRKPQMLVERLR